MTGGPVRVRELVGWGLDASPYREAWVAVRGGEVERRVEAARAIVRGRCAWRDEGALVESALRETGEMRELLERQRERVDLRREMRGLVWEVGVVDLRRLLAFQRRLVFDGEPAAPVRVPAERDARGCVELAFGAPRAVADAVVESVGGGGFEVRSGNPDLRWRLADAGEGGAALVLDGGSPFLEVAEFRGRWFLRDGYHRAYACLRAGLWRMPAVVVRARTMDEVRPGQPWFFDEAVLFGPAPPRVTDFRDAEMCLEYCRPRLVKRLRVVVDETIGEETELPGTRVWPTDGGESDEHSDEAW